MWKMLQCDKEKYGCILVHFHFCDSFCKHGNSADNSLEIAHTYGKAVFLNNYIWKLFGLLPTSNLYMGKRDIQ